MQVISKNETKRHYLKVELRYLLSYIFFYYQIVIIEVLNNINLSSEFFKTTINLSIIILRVYFILNVISIVMSIFKKEKVFLYEKITNTTTISTIEYEEEQEEKDDKEETNVRIKKDK